MEGDTNPKFWSNLISLRIAVVVLGVGLIAAIGALVVIPRFQQPTPDQPPQAESICLPVADEFTNDDPQAAQLLQLDKEEYFVRGQVIVIGSETDINFQEAALKDGRLSKIDLRAVEECDLNFLSDSVFDDQLSETDTVEEDGTVERKLSQALDQGLIVRLYRFAKEVPLETVIGAFNDTDLAVFAERDFLIGFPTGNVCGSPDGAEGSAVTSFQSDASPAAFEGQWAFEKVALINSSGIRVTQTGQGVTVGVFDTSPFWSGLENATINAIDPPLTLQLSSQLTPDFTFLTTTADSVPMKDHGLFVASLIHAVAPESDIHLIEVLDDNGCGSLSDLYNALYDFVNQMKNDETGQLDKVVINLSLGFVNPKESLPKSIKVILEDARSSGAVIVAAAGNESNGDADRHNSQAPASYNPHVISVVASNFDDLQSCFSNKGDVMASGGDAPLAITENEVNKCVPKLNLCPDVTSTGECKDAIIGLSTASNTDYAFWAGTSFSTPLVSGLAALLLGEGKDLDPDMAYTIIRPDDVPEVLPPLINIQEALQP